MSRHSIDPSKLLPLCYVAHPLGGGEDRDANIEAAGAILAVLQKMYPEKVFVASWITLARYYPETPENREAGIKADLALISHCQEIWLCGPRLSPGMQQELEHAQKKGLLVVNKLHEVFSV